MTAVSALVRDVRAAFPSAIAFLKLRTDGAGYYDSDGGTARRSLWAFWLALPLDLALSALVLSAKPDGLDFPAATSTALLYPAMIVLGALQWYLYPVLTYPLVLLLGRGARFAQFVTVYNWTNFAWELLILAPAIVLQAVVGNEGVVQLIYMLRMTVTVAQRCIVNAISLDIGALPACIMALVELCIGFGTQWVLWQFLEQGAA